MYEAEIPNDLSESIAAVNHGMDIFTDLDVAPWVTGVTIFIACKDTKNKIHWTQACGYRSFNSKFYLLSKISLTGRIAAQI